MGLLEFNIMHYVLRLFISVFLGGIMVLGNAQTQIAFISDAHIQNVDGHPERVRSMEVQVQSTRLFNENYYAFLAALDDVARRNIRWVVLPGDLTDNGQFFNQEKIKEILHAYAGEKGMRFFVTTGNHDPALPLGMRQKNVHFLSADGGRVTREDSCAGYVPQMQCYADFGFFPRKDDRYWESPFTSYTYDKYSYGEACRESVLDKRTYVLCNSLTATDASYLVEPVDGLWLLAIDGGVYLPKEFPLKELPVENNRLSVAVCEDGYDFFQLKNLLENLLLTTSVEYRLVRSTEPYLHSGVSADIITKDGKKIGYFGKIHKKVLKNYDISHDVYYAELDTDYLASLPEKKFAVKEISKFPAVERDIAVVVDESVTNGDLTHAIKSACGKVFESVELFDVYRSAQLGENKKSLAYKIRLMSEDKTLTTEEINAVINKILKSLEFRYHAKLRV